MGLVAIFFSLTRLGLMIDLRICDSVMVIRVGVVPVRFGPSAGYHD
jgi:hypothetical protein